MKPAPGANKFVLLVEDNPNDVLLTRRAFARNGLGDQLTVVRDGVEALEFLLNAEVKPAFVLMDLKLPRLDGLQVLRRLRADQRTRNLLIFMLTSSDEEEDQRQGLEGGLDGYIRKPVDFSEFVEIIHQLSLCWLQRDDTVPPGKEM